MQRFLLCAVGSLIAIPLLLGIWRELAPSNQPAADAANSVTTVRMVREVKTNVASENEIVFQCKDRVVRVSGDERVRVPLARPTRLFAWHYGGEPVVIGEEDVGPIYHEVECIREPNGLVIWRLYEWSK